MLNLDQAILPKEFKFRETGRHLAKMIRLEKQVNQSHTILKVNFFSKSWILKKRKKNRK